MPFEIVHFRDSDKILRDKRMMKDVQTTLQYLDDVLYEAPNRGNLMKEALEEMGWRENGTLTILEGRGYRFTGLKNRVALHGNLASYEGILEGLFRLQIGSDKGNIDTGILLLTNHRSEKTPFGSSRELVEWEVEQLQPTISVPVTIVLFDLGELRRIDKKEDLTELREHHTQNS